MNVHPFQFDLPKLTGRELMLHEALFSFLPKTGLWDKASAAIAEALEKQIGIPVPFKLEGVAELPFHAFAQKLADPAFICVIGLPPTAAKFFLDVDMATALLIIDCMLGGETSERSDLRVPSEIEQGVFQYLLLQLLSHLGRIAGGHPQLGFRLERFIFAAAGLQPYAADSEHLSVLTFRLHLGAVDGFVRLCFPRAFIEEAFLEVKSGGSETPEERERELKVLQQFQDLRFPIWAEAGRMTLTRSELQALETGDVILLEDAELILQDGEAEGRVALKFGYGKEKGFVADLTMGPRKAHCRIVDVTSG